MNFWGKGIIRSLLISYKNQRRGVITVQYPHEKLELPERARWAVEMTRDDEGNHKCTACLACERACPDYIIKIDVTTAEDRTKHIDAWNYEIGACMMCGLCVEACPFDAIHMGHEYELARTDPAQLTVQLLADTDAAKPKRKEPATTARPAQSPVGSEAPSAASAPETLRQEPKEEGNDGE